jgi:purine-binding chemotaxis protein CheW
MSDADVTTNQFLTFTLGEEIYALEIDVIREVLEMTAITKIPRTPESMRGVINLRGAAVPVLDMRRKFGMGKVEQTVETCIIIVEVEFEGEETHIGALVDSVREVYEMPPDTVEAPPKMGTDIDAEYIKGIGRQDDAFIIILDNRKVFSAEELAAAKSAADMAPTAEPAADESPAPEEGMQAL